MYWLMILAAGVLETVWAVGLKASDGLTRPWISIGTRWHSSQAWGYSP